MSAAPGERSNRWMVTFALVTAVVLAAAVAAAYVVGRARITGGTPAERIAAICRVADEGRPGAGAAIAAAADDDPSPAVRRVALLALARFIDAEHRGLVEAATRDADPGVRAAAAATLGEFDDDSAADRLGELAAKDGDEQVRLAAADGLERCGTDKAVVGLVETMENNDNPKVREHARSAVLRRLNWPERNTRAADVAMWRNDVELIKVDPAVVAAYKTAGVQLVHHLEYIIPEPGE